MKSGAWLGDVTPGKKRRESSKIKKTVREKDLTESYGIRTRGPLGDMGTAKPRTAEIQGTGSDSITLLPEMNIEDSKMDVSNLLSKTKINYASTDFEGKITPTIKLHEWTFLTLYLINF